MRTTLARVGALVATVVLGTSLMATAPAVADDTPPPVVVDDMVSLYPGQMTELDVLANDSSPSGEDLALCRVPEPEFGKSVLAMPEGGDSGKVMLMASARARGTHVVKYFVCDLHHLTPAKLTVVIKAVQPVSVHKVAGKPGRLTVTNHNAAPVRFWFGSPRTSHPDGKVRIPAHGTRTVRVQRHRIVWFALIGGGSGKDATFRSPGIADRGVIRHIKLNRKPLPEPKRDAGDGRLASGLPVWAPTR